MDFESILLDLGWVKLTDKIFIAEDGVAIDLAGPMIEVIDAVYIAGWNGGLQRSLYENETQEDVE